MKTITLKIGGMSCEHCVKAVNNALEDLGNISNICVNLKDNSATFDYDESKITIESIQAEIVECGYEVL